MGGRSLRFGLLIYAALLGIVIVLPGMGQLPESDHKANAQEAQQPQTIDPDANPERQAATPKKAEKDSDNGSKQKKDHCKYGGPNWFAGFYCFFAHHEKFWIAFGTLVLAVATGVLGFATFFLWRATRRLVIDANSALTKLQRAFVFVKEIDVLEDRDVKVGVYQYRVAAILENGGQSPAVRMVFSFRCEAVPEEEIATFYCTNGDVRRGVLGPKATVSTISTRIKPTDVGRIRKEEARWFIWGWIDYDDIFEGTPRHRTEFCFEVKPRPMASGTPLFSFPMHDRYNATDDDCLRKPAPYQPA